MKPRIIQLKLTGVLVGDEPPKAPGVDGGDTVQWSSDDGDVTVTFPDDHNPFNNGNVFKASAKGQLTQPKAVVDLNVNFPDHFACTITIGGVTFRNTVGVDTPGS